MLPRGTPAVPAAASADGAGTESHRLFGGGRALPPRRARRRAAAASEGRAGADGGGAEALRRRYERRGLAGADHADRLGPVHRLAAQVAPEMLTTAGGITFLSGRRQWPKGLASQIRADFGQIWLDRGQVRPNVVRNPQLLAPNLTNARQICPGIRQVWPISPTFAPVSADVRQSWRGIDQI